jgi:hypothetical protein
MALTRAPRSQGRAARPGTAARGVLPAAASRVAAGNLALRSLVAAPLDRRFVSSGRGVACAAAAAPAKEETFQYQAEVRTTQGGGRAWRLRPLQRRPPAGTAQEPASRRAAAAPLLRR